MTTERRSPRKSGRGSGPAADELAQDSDMQDVAVTSSTRRSRRSTAGMAPSKRRRHDSDDDAIADEEMAGVDEQPQEAGEHREHDEQDLPIPTSKARAPYAILWAPTRQTTEDTEGSTGDLGVSSSTAAMPENGKDSSANDDGEEDGDEEDVDDNEDEDLGEPEERLDFEGDGYIDVMGRPAENKELRLRAFVLPNRHPERLYLLILDVAKLAGIGDSFRFFKVNPDIPRMYLSRAETSKLIALGLVHPIMKLRRVPIISVASCYKRLGSRLLRSTRSSRREDRTSRFDEDDEYARLAFHKSLMAQSDSVRVAQDLIKDLKPAAPLSAPNVDWIYRCALGAAGYNAQMRLQRQDRLWGPVQLPEEEEEKAKPRNPYFDDGELSDGFDSSRAVSPIDGGENGATAPARTSRRGSVEQLTFRQGYPDAHTGITHVPRSTQYEHLRVESTGVTIRDAIKPLPQAVKNHTATVDLVLNVSDMPQSALPLRSADPVPASKIFGSASGGRANVDRSEYPLSLMPGQFQETFSIFPTRFGQSRLPPPGQQQPRAQFQTGSQFMQAPIAAAGVATRPFIAAPSTTSGFVSAPGRPRTASFPTAEAHAPTSILCGFRTSTGQSCRQKVLKQGERCFAHRNLAEDANADEPDGPAVICPLCTNGILPEKEKDRAQLTNRDLIAYASVQCATCKQIYHERCLDHCTSVVAAKIKTYEWQCGDSKLCSTCRDTGEEDDILLCDACDRGYHTTCLDPPLKKLPEGNWLCDKCTPCWSCDKKTTPATIHHVVGTGDRYVASYCKACHSDFEADRFCVVCLKTHAAKGKSVQGMVECSACKLHVHSACDTVGTSDCDVATYKCPVCQSASVMDDEPATALTMPGERKRKRGRPRKNPLPEDDEAAREKDRMPLSERAEEARKEKSVCARYIVEVGGKKMVAPLSMLA